MTVEKRETYPWHVTVNVDDVPEAGRHVTLTADEATRAAVARFAGLQSVDRLEAEFDLARRGRRGLHVTGEVKAQVRQTCVVTLEPIDNTVVEAIDVDFIPQGLEVEFGSLERPDKEDDEAPEYLVDGSADLGALAVEFLILGIDPYPRKSGADFVAPKAESDEISPFAALAKLRRPSDGGN